MLNILASCVWCAMGDFYSLIGMTVMLYALAVVTARYSELGQEEASVGAIKRDGAEAGYAVAFKNGHQ